MSLCSLLSGGADSSIAIWDLEAANPLDDGSLVHQPLEYAAKSVTNLYRRVNPMRYAH